MKLAQISDFNLEESNQIAKPLDVTENSINEADEIPEIGDTVRTRKLQMTGKVERVDGGLVFFRTSDRRLMKAPMENVSVVEKLADENFGMQEGFPYDVDHMPGRTVRGEFDNKTIRYFYNEWKELADRSNSEQHNNGLVISSGPNSVIYQSDDGTIYAHWDKNKKVGFIKGKTTEGMMGGINRSRPAQDVSYEKVLDEVMSKWEESCRTDELSVDAMNKYKAAVTSPAAVRTRPLRKLAKSVQGIQRATDKINVKTGNRTHPNARYGEIRQGTYEERLKEFISLDEDDFSSILQKQHANDQAAKKKPIVDIPFHGWKIRYRPASDPGDKVTWIVLNKKHEEVKRGESMSDKDAVADAEEWIKSGGGTKQEASSNVTIDFNVDFAREFAPGGDTLYVSFDRDGNTPMLLVSLVPQQGFKKTHIRNQKHKMTATTTGLPMVTLSAKESNALGLQPNGRYLLGGKDPIDDNTAMFPLIFQGTVQGKGDMVKMGKPGLTVAHAREMDEDCWDGYTQIGMKDKGGKQVPNCVPSTNEVYQGPWQGDPEKYAKVPKSQMQGKGDVRLSDLVQDTIKAFGIKDAFAFYVKKHGMPPRHFKIYAGL